MEGNKVKITIFDREYTIIGDKPKEHIIKVATHVNSKMQEIGDSFSGPASGVAVLTAVNIADEYFSLLDRVESLTRANEQAEMDNQRYIQLWEEAKNNYKEYREKSLTEMEGVRQQREELIAQLSEKEREIEELLKKERSIDREAQRGAHLQVEEIEKKYKELENNFFDVQMENTRMKSELERYKR